MFRILKETNIDFIGHRIVLFCVKRSITYQLPTLRHDLAYLIRNMDEFNSSFFHKHLIELDIIFYFFSSNSKIDQAQSMSSGQTQSIRVLQLFMYQLRPL